MQLFQDSGPWFPSQTPPPFSVQTLCANLNRSQLCFLLIREPAALSHGKNQSEVETIDNAPD